MRNRRESGNSGMVATLPATECNIIRWAFDAGGVCGCYDLTWAKRSRHVIDTTGKDEQTQHCDKQQANEMERKSENSSS